jgi:hypothetical protein
MESLFNILLVIYFTGIIAVIAFAYKNVNKKNPIRDNEWGLLMFFSLFSWLMLLVMIIGAAFHIGEKEEEIYTRHIESNKNIVV